MKRSTFLKTILMSQSAFLLAVSSEARADIRTDTTGWQPFDAGLDGLEGGIDVGAMIGHKPAGKFGFLTVRDARFRFEKEDAPARLWGVNFTTGAAFPAKPDAERLARHLSRLGFNSVRFHHINLDILDRTAGDTRHLSADALDRLDHFIYRLKENGIYANLNLLTNKWDAYKAADGVIDADKLGKNHRVAHFFDPRLIELQKEFARQLLTHRNPYTGLRYVDDPAVAIVELINETSFSGSGETGSDNSKLPPHYARQLDALFNKWVRAKYSGKDALITAWGALRPGEDYETGTLQRIGLRIPDGGAPSPRQRDTARFYLDVEMDYYREMKRFLREDLGFRGLINGTNNWYGVATLKAQTVMDYTDIHGYVDHPTFPTASWDRNNFTLMQEAAVNRPEGRSPGRPPAWFNMIPIPKWALGGVAGMPLVSSEWNWAFPNRYNFEGPLLVCAYGSLQDMSGFFQFTYNNALKPGPGFFDLQPAMRVQMPVAALAFRRGYVQTAKETVTLPFSEAETIDASLENGTAFTHNVTPELPLSTALVHKIRKDFRDDARPASNRTGAAAVKPPFRSDTGELVWDSTDPKRGRVTIDTPKLQAAVGFIADRAIALADLTVRLQDDAAISLISLDDKPLAGSRSMLLTAAGYQENTGQVWKDDYKGVTDWGKLPVLMAPVRGEVEIATMHRDLKVHALDASGKRKQEVPVSPTPRGLKFAIGDAGTAWYRVEAAG